MLRKELKERFIEDLTPAEKAFFLRKAKEAIAVNRYRASEDLFHYCYFLALRERLRGLSPHRGDGHLRFLLVHGMRDIEEAIGMYRERLEADKSPEPDRAAEKKFIEYFSVQE